MGKSSGSQTTTQKTELPAWVQAAGESNVQFANNVANNLMGPYAGQTVAGMTDQQQSALNSIYGNTGASANAFGQALGAVGSATGYTPQQVTAGNISDGISGYMNPYLDAVETRALDAIDRQRQQSLNQVADSAIGSGAAWGSRQGVMEGVTNAEAARAAGDLSANIRSQGFNTAAGLSAQDIGNSMQAQLANQGAGYNAAALGLQSGLGLGSLAMSGQQAGLNAANQYQLQNQAELDAAANYYNQQRQQPIDQLNIRLQALGMTPYGNTTTQTVPTTGSPFGQLLGLGLQGASLFMSDKNMKTDVTKVGKDPDTGLDMYAYRYKGDPKSYPKVVGPMAQDIEKAYPGSTKKIGGKMAVNLGFGGMA